MFSEINQTQRGKYCVILFTRHTGSSQIHRESRVVVARGLGEEEMEILFNGHRSLF